ncbi:SRPBCC family protein [Hyalangium versicolor]|uniref:SRPBCC family protein n=1 Tax=Hyalangium versicolor TaxID=2861190 RepID=UPI001CD03255|nr:SRPBCC family protein [Hyalangium versicolor]
MESNWYHFNEHWEIPGFTPGEVWQVVVDATKLPEWWSGVYQEVSLVDPGEDSWSGACVRARARGLLPYQLHFTLEPMVLEPGREIEIRTHGDFEGIWRATFSSTEDGTWIDIQWSVSVSKPLIRYTSWLLKPIFAWNHRWTMPRGEAGLRAYLAAQRASSEAGELDASFA